MLTNIEVGKLYKTTLGVVVIATSIEIYDSLDYVVYERLDEQHSDFPRSIEYTRALEVWSDVDWDE